MIAADGEVRRLLVVGVQVPKPVVDCGEVAGEELGKLSAQNNSAVQGRMDIAHADGQVVQVSVPQPGIIRIALGETREKLLQ